MTTTDPMAYHVERSWHFLELVDSELANGELEEASNKLWGAAAHAIKAVAEKRVGSTVPMPCWKKPSCA